MTTALDETTPPRPSPNPFSLGFRTPAAPPSSSLPSPSESPETSPAEDLEPASDEWDAASFPESLDGDSSARTSGSPSDVEAQKVDLFDEDDLQALARGGVAVAGERAHALLATTEGKKAVGLMLTDEQDQAQIGDPVARIAARHAGDAVGPVNPDVKDLFASLVGLFSYGVKQINKVTEARLLDSGAQPVQQHTQQGVDL